MGKNLLSTEQKTDIVKWYFEVKYDKKVKNKFISKYPRNVSPTKQTVLNNVKNFIKFGSVLNRQKNTPDKKTVITPENIQKVKNCLKSGEAKSVSKIGLKTVIGRESVRNILNKELKLFPYKVQIVQKIPENSIKKRLEFCQNMLKNMEIILIH
jgi:hypothetical protein